LDFGDVFSYALAKVRGIPLLSKGGDFALTDLARAARTRRAGGNGGRAPPRGSDFAPHHSITPLTAQTSRAQGAEDSTWIRRHRS